MKKNKTDCLLLVFSVIGYFLMSVSFVLMPINGVGVIPGSLFWGGLLIGVALQIVLEVRRRRFFAKHSANYKRMQKPRNGLLSFRSNPYAAIADYVMIAGFIATILAFILTKGTGLVCFVFISITLFAFCLHCILNGRIYFYSKNQPRIQQVLEERNRKKEGEGKL